MQGYSNFLTSHRRAIPDGYGWLQDRLLQPNIFPLVVLLLLTVAIKFIVVVYTYVVPIKMLGRLIGYYISRVCCGYNKHTHTPTTSSDPTTTDLTDNNTHTNTYMDNIRRRSSINAYDLMQLDDLNRQEAAPFSEQYYSYVINKDEIPTNCMKIFKTNKVLYYILYVYIMLYI